MRLRIGSWDILILPAGSAGGYGPGLGAGPRPGGLGGLKGRWVGEEWWHPVAGVGLAGILPVQRPGPCWGVGQSAAVTMT